MVPTKAKSTIQRVPLANKAPVGALAKAQGGSHWDARCICRTNTATVLAQLLLTVDNETLNIMSSIVWSVICERVSLSTWKICHKKAGKKLKMTKKNRIG